MKGMLASAETIEVVADSLREYKVAIVVVDPVSRESIFFAGHV